MTHNTEELPCIAIGRGAFANRPYEIVLNVELHDEAGKYTTLRAVMTPEEFKHVRAVFERLGKNFEG